MASALGEKPAVIKNGMLSSAALGRSNSVGKMENREITASRHSPRFQGRRAWLVALIVMAVAFADWFALGADTPQAAAWLLASRDWVAAHLLVAALFFGLLYVAFAALSLPGAWTIERRGRRAVRAVARRAPGLALQHGRRDGRHAGGALSRFATFASSARFPDFVARVNRGLARDGVALPFRGAADARHSRSSRSISRSA